MFKGNRIVEDIEILTGYGYSDYYYVENNYLQRANILLADITKQKEVVPMVDSAALSTYLSNSAYPKNIILDTSKVITLDSSNYADFDPQFEYDQWFNK